jgi:hypothetical protein
MTTASSSHAPSTAETAVAKRRLRGDTFLVRSSIRLAAKAGRLQASINQI